jgi:hypothetical protein
VVYECGFDLVGWKCAFTELLCMSRVVIIAETEGWLKCCPLGLHCIQLLIIAFAYVKRGTSV